MPRDEVLCNMPRLPFELPVIHKRIILIFVDNAHPARPPFLGPAQWSLRSPADQDVRRDARVPSSATPPPLFSLSLVCLADPATKPLEE